MSRVVSYLPITRDVFLECALGKSHKANHPKISNTSKTKKHKLLATEMCGMFRTTSLGGSKYFFTITDDYSKITWAFFLKNKINTFAIFKNFY